jgi:nucleotide-binding universal stress UspA family protein
MTHTILLPFDGSDGATRAAEAALDYAAREGGIVHALWVVDTTRYGEPALSSAEIVVDDAEDEAHDRLAALAERAAADGVAVETCCCHGDPTEELLAYAGEVDATVVVLSRRLPHRARTQLAESVDTVLRPAVAVA